MQEIFAFVDTNEVRALDLTSVAERLTATGIRHWLGAVEKGRTVKHRNIEEAFEKAARLLGQRVHTSFETRAFTQMATRGDADDEDAPTHTRTVDVTAPVHVAKIMNTYTAFELDEPSDRERKTVALAVEPLEGIGDSELKAKAMFLATLFGLADTRHADPLRKAYQSDVIGNLKGVPLIFVENGDAPPSGDYQRENKRGDVWQPILPKDTALQWKVQKFFDSVIQP